MRTMKSVLIGGLLGAGIAFLTAPQSGKRTRRDLRNFGRRIGRSVEDISAVVQDGVGKGLEWTFKAGKATGKTYMRGMNLIRRAA